MRAEGHEIGNHLVEDRPSVLLGDEEFERQLLVVDPWVDAQARWRWLRPGSGWFTPTMTEQAARHGYRLCLGSIFPHDDVVHDPDRLAAEVLGRVRPGDVIVLQQIAICYTRIGLVSEAAKTYRHVLQKAPNSAGAHYGLAFILLRTDSPRESIAHLEAFLANAPKDEEASAHVDHARHTLAQLREQSRSGAFGEGTDAGV